MESLTGAAKSGRVCDPSEPTKLDTRSAFEDEDDGWADYLYWQAQDKKTLKRVNTLLQDIERNGPHGIGNPELLRGLPGYWSRRINEKDRLIYKIMDQQVDLLFRRGMTGDRCLMKERLATVNYYRLSGYWYPFRNPDDTFKEGTTFDKVWRRYAFDRRLRLLVMDAIERFEVAIRTQFAHHHAIHHGPFAYANDPKSRPKMERKDFADLYAKVLEELSRSKEPFVKHFYSKYGDSHDAPPIWEAVEVMSFGNIVTLYKNTTHKVKQDVANVFDVPDTILESWLQTLNTIRNICAHHGRLWNRELGYKPFIPHAASYPQWHDPVKVPNDRIFGILTICKHCLNRIAPQSKWPDDLNKLLADYPDIPRLNMGIPANWSESPIWKGSAHGG